jgi:hypothetical protein
MEKTFPLDLPWPTAFYLAMYLLTFVLHQAFMHYVLAGSLYVAWVTIWRGSDPLPRADQPIASILRDWMPFLLSAAITAGVAPLLFIQIVYQHQFYTANLLLWWRWMLVVPVLIVAFYLLYLLKSQMLWRWPWGVQVIVAVGAAISFVFTGFSWTVNHLLANNGTTWPDVYVTGRLPFATTTVFLRMLIWMGGSFASMSIIVGWQLLQRSAINRQTAKESHQRQLAIMGMGGLLITLICCVLFLFQCDSHTRSVLFGPAFRLYLLAAAAGTVAQFCGWILQIRNRRLGGLGLFVTSAGAIMSLATVAVLREGVRLADVDLTSLSDRHIAAATVGGFGIFLVASIVVGAMIVWCIRLVATGTMTKQSSNDLESVEIGQRIPEGDGTNS